MSFANLPPPVATFLRALQACDHTELLATLAGTAVVVDRGKEYRGDALKEWGDRAYRGAVATAHPINVVRQGPKIALTVMLSGKPAIREWAARPRHDDLTRVGLDLCDELENRMDWKRWRDDDNCRSIPVETRRGATPSTKLKLRVWYRPRDAGGTDRAPELARRATDLMPSSRLGAERPSALNALSEKVDWHCA